MFHYFSQLDPIRRSFNFWCSLNQLYFEPKEEEKETLEADYICAAVLLILLWPT
jgi:hypothetical protein